MTSAVWCHITVITRYVTDSRRKMTVIWQQMSELLYKKLYNCYITAYITVI